MVDDFRHDYFFLSNMYPVEIPYMGYVFPSVENAYQAMKCDDPSHYADFVGVNPPTAKKMGKFVKLCNDWDNVKYNLMRDLLDIKFSNKELLHKLHATAPETIIEGNTWHDNYWGWCRCERCRDKLHHNHLGELLQRKRNLTIPNPDIYTMYCGAIYHRDEKMMITRPAFVYDRDTYTLLRIGNHDWCMGYLEKAVGAPGLNIACYEFDSKMTAYEICEEMNRLLQYTGYLEVFMKEHEQ